MEWRYFVTDNVNDVNIYSTSYTHPEYLTTFTERTTHLAVEHNGHILGGIQRGCVLG